MANIDEDIYLSVTFTTICPSFTVEPAGVTISPTQLTKIVEVDESASMG